MKFLFMYNFSSACERNKDHLLLALTPWFKQSTSVFEIGSYSGQHAFHFCQAFPHLQWQMSDRAEHIAGLASNLEQADLANCLPPQELDVTNAKHWPDQAYDIVYTTNTLHIMSWQSVEKFLSHLSKVCKGGSLFVVYGPFKYQGNYTSDSNAQFQQWLQDRDPLSGIRDFELVDNLIQQQGFELLSDTSMPANNQLIIWKMKS